MKSTASELSLINQSRPSMQSTCDARGTLNSCSTRAADPDLIFRISAVEHVACFALSTKFILRCFLGCNLQQRRQEMSGNRRPALSNF